VTAVREQKVQYTHNINNILITTVYRSNKSGTVDVHLNIKYFCQIQLPVHNTYVDADGNRITYSEQRGEEEI